MDFLPFQAIYRTPLHILTGEGLTISDYLQAIGVQKEQDISSRTRKEWRLCVR